MLTEQTAPPQFQMVNSFSMSSVKSRNGNCMKDEILFNIYRTEHDTSASLWIKIKYG